MTPNTLQAPGKAPALGPLAVFLLLLPTILILAGVALFVWVL